MTIVRHIRMVDSQKQWRKSNRTHRVVLTLSQIRRNSLPSLSPPPFFLHHLMQPPLAPLRPLQVISCLDTATWTPLVGVLTIKQLLTAKDNLKMIKIWILLKQQRWKHLEKKQTSKAMASCCGDAETSRSLPPFRRDWMMLDSPIQNTKNFAQATYNRSERSQKLSSQMGTERSQILTEFMIFRGKLFSISSS